MDEIEIMHLLWRHGKSGVVSKRIEFGSCLIILANRKEGVVGAVLKPIKEKLLLSGEKV